MKGKERRNRKQDENEWDGEMLKRVIQKHTHKKNTSEKYKLKKNKKNKQQSNRIIHLIWKIRNEQFLWTNHRQFSEEKTRTTSTHENKISTQT